MYDPLYIFYVILFLKSDLCLFDIGSSSQLDTLFFANIVE